MGLKNWLEGRSGSGFNGLTMQMKQHIQCKHLIGQAVGAEGRRELVASLLLPCMYFAEGRKLWPQEPKHVLCSDSGEEKKSKHANKGPMHCNVQKN